VTEFALVLVVALALGAAVGPTHAFARGLAVRALALVRDERAALGAVLALGALLVVRARADAALAALAQRDWSVHLAALEGPLLESVQRAFGAAATRGAAAVHAWLPLALVLGLALAPRRADRTRLHGVHTLLCSAATVLPLAALVPLAGPASCRLLELAPLESALHVAARAALVDLALVAALASAADALRRGARREALVVAAAALVYGAAGLVCGALWLTTLATSCLGAWAALAVLRAVARATGSTSTHGTSD
jgi:hypothetical protein